jgi:hypothetical protein
LGRIGDAETERLDVVGAKDLTWMRRIVHHRSGSLVVVLVVDLVAVASVKAEGDSPVSVHVDGPLPLAPAFERVEPEPWRIEVSNIGRGVKPRENTTDLRDVIGV